eukprot:TRINITY_DN18042_c0_g1_i1.p1 TRINITY_DN18042_c0_g1~~TRINITY_DN18042_c0_g1_i1.p1  ORF type:complete len:1851 (+),score=286.08 TRINITY_DN18042_c0_g1_i1:114-5666(+)
MLGNTFTLGIPGQRPAEQPQAGAGQPPGADQPAPASRASGRPRGGMRSCFQASLRGVPATNHTADTPAPQPGSSQTAGVESQPSFESSQAAGPEAENSVKGHPAVWASVPGCCGSELDPLAPGSYCASLALEAVVANLLPAPNRIPQVGKNTAAGSQQQGSTIEASCGELMEQGVLLLRRIAEVHDWEDVEGDHDSAHQTAMIEASEGLRRRLQTENVERSADAVLRTKEQQDRMVPAVKLRQLRTTTGSAPPTQNEDSGDDSEAQGPESPRTKAPSAAATALREMLSSGKELHWVPLQELVEGLASTQGCGPSAAEAGRLLSQIIHHQLPPVPPPSGDAAAAVAEEEARTAQILMRRGVQLLLSCCALHLCAAQPLPGANEALELCLDAIAAARRDTVLASCRHGKAQRAIVRIELALRQSFRAVTRLCAEGHELDTVAERLATAAVHSAFNGGLLGAPALDLLREVCIRRPDARVTAAEELAEAVATSSRVSGGGDCSPGGLLPVVESTIDTTAPAGVSSPAEACRKASERAAAREGDDLLAAGSQDPAAGEAKLQVEGTIGTLASVLLYLVHAAATPSAPSPADVDGTGAMNLLTAAATLAARALRGVCERLFAPWRLQGAAERHSAHSVVAEVVDDLCRAAMDPRYPAAPMLVGVATRVFSAYARMERMPAMEAGLPQQQQAAQTQLRTAALGAVGRIARSIIAAHAGRDAAGRRLMQRLRAVPQLQDPAQWSQPDGMTASDAFSAGPSQGERFASSTPTNPADDGGTLLRWTQGAQLRLLQAEQDSAPQQHFALCAAAISLRRRMKAAKKDDQGKQRKRTRKDRDNSPGSGASPTNSQQEEILREQQVVNAARGSVRANAGGLEQAKALLASRPQDIALWAGSEAPLAPYGADTRSIFVLFGVLVGAITDSAAAAACRRRALGEASRLLALGAAEVREYGVRLLRRALAEPSATVRAAALDLVPVVRRALAKGDPGSPVAVQELLALLSVERSNTVLRRVVAILRKVAQNAGPAVRVRICEGLLTALTPLLARPRNQAVKCEVRLRDDVVSVVRLLWFPPSVRPVIRERAVRELGAVLLLRSASDSLRSFDPSHPLVAAVRFLAQGAAEVVEEVAAAARDLGGCDAAAVLHCCIIAYPPCCTSTTAVELARRLAEGPSGAPGVWYHAAGAVSAACRGARSGGLRDDALRGSADALAQVLKKERDNRIITQACAAIGSAAAPHTAHGVTALRLLQGALCDANRWVPQLTLKPGTPDAERLLGLLVSRILNWAFIVAELVRHLHPATAVTRSLPSVSPDDAVAHFAAAGPLSAVEQFVATLSNSAEQLPADCAHRLQAMAVRVHTALCAQQPLLYWAGGTQLLRNALAGAAQAAQQALEGMRDLLIREARRMEANTGRAVECDSGIGGAIAQQFVAEATRVCSSGHNGARRAAGRLLCLVADNGLCIPNTIAPALAALAAGPPGDSPQEAEASLQSVARRTAAQGQLTAHVVRGWTRAFVLHAAATGGYEQVRGIDQQGASVHAGLWRAARAAGDEEQTRTVLRQLLRLLHDAERIRSVMQELEEGAVNPPSDRAARSAFGINLIRFVAEGLVAAPLSKRWEVLHLIGEIDNALDRRGEECLAAAKRGPPADAAGALPPLFLWLQLCGLWLLAAMKGTLRMHYQVTAAEQRRFAEAPRERARRELRAPETAAALLEFAADAGTFCQAAHRRAAAPAADSSPVPAGKKRRGPSGKKGAVKKVEGFAAAWQWVTAETAAALAADATASLGARQRQAAEETDSDADSEERQERLRLRRCRARLAAKRRQPARRARPIAGRVDEECMLSSEESSGAADGPNSPRSGADSDD